MKKRRKFRRRWRTKGIGLPLQGKDYFQDDYRGRHARVLPTATMVQAYGLAIFFPHFPNGFRLRQDFGATGKYSPLFIF